MQKLVPDKSWLQNSTKRYSPKACSLILLNQTFFVCVAVHMLFSDLNVPSSTPFLSWLALSPSSRLRYNIIFYHDPLPSCILLYSQSSWKWQPIPVFLPGKSHGQRSLAGSVHGLQRVGHDWATKHSKQLICANIIVIITGLCSLLGDKFCLFPVYAFWTWHRISSQ